MSHIILCVYIFRIPRILNLANLMNINVFIKILVSIQNLLAISEVNLHGDTWTDDTVTVLDRNM